MLYAYQIGAEVQKRLGFKEGLITIYHQDHRKDKGYLKNLEALSYAMLYGKNDAINFFKSFLKISIAIITDVFC